MTTTELVNQSKAVTVNPNSILSATAQANTKLINVSIGTAGTKFYIRFADLNATGSPQRDFYKFHLMLRTPPFSLKIDTKTIDCKLQTSSGTD